jgi:hypothetical protein
MYIIFLFYFKAIAVLETEKKMEIDPNKANTKLGEYDVVIMKKKISIK